MGWAVSFGDLNLSTAATVLSVHRARPGLVCGGGRAGRWVFMGAQPRSLKPGANQRRGLLWTVYHQGGTSRAGALISAPFGAPLRFGEVWSLT